nr:hypothetical protein [Bacteroidota bacterium]
MKTIAAVFLIALPTLCLAQKQGAVWCFGDSALINFADTANISTATSFVKSRGSCASICDSVGDLITYTFYDNDVYTMEALLFKEEKYLINKIVC